MKVTFYNYNCSYSNLYCIVKVYITRVFLPILVPTIQFIKMFKELVKNFKNHQLQYCIYESHILLPNKFKIYFAGAIIVSQKLFS